MLCSIVLAQLMPTKPHCSMWNSFCTAAEFPSGCRVLCAQRTASHTKASANNASESPQPI